MPSNLPASHLLPLGSVHSRSPAGTCAQASGAAPQHELLRAALRQHGAQLRRHSTQESLQQAGQKLRSAMEAPVKAAQAAGAVLSKAPTAAYARLPAAARKWVDATQQPGSLQRVLSLQLDAFWQRHGRTVYAAGAVMAAYVLWRSMYGVASMFVTLSDRMAAAGFMVRARPVAGDVQAAAPLALPLGWALQRPSAGRRLTAIAAATAAAAAGPGRCNGTAGCAVPATPGGGRPSGSLPPGHAAPQHAPGHPGGAATGRAGPHERGQGGRGRLAPPHAGLASGWLLATAQVMGAPLAGSDVRASVLTGGGLKFRGLRPRLRARRVHMMFPLRGSDRRGLVSLEAKKRKVRSAVQRKRFSGSCCC